MPKARQEVPSDLYTQRVAALNAAVIRREELVARRRKKAKEWRHFIDALCMGLKAAVAGAFIGIGAWIWNMPEVGRKTWRLYVPGYRADGRGRTDAESHCTCCSMFGWLTGSAASRLVLCVSAQGDRYAALVRGDVHGGAGPEGRMGPRTDLR